MQVESIPEEPVDWLATGVIICRCLFALAVALAVSQALREGVRLLDDMKSAMEVERPIRTRSAYIAPRGNFLPRGYFHQVRLKQLMKPAPLTRKTLGCHLRAKAFAQVSSQTHPAPAGAP